MPVFQKQIYNSDLDWPELNFIYLFIGFFTVRFMMVRNIIHSVILEAHDGKCSNFRVKFAVFSKV